MLTLPLQRKSRNLARNGDFGIGPQTDDRIEVCVENHFLGVVAEFSYDMDANVDPILVILLNDEWLMLMGFFLW